MEYNSKENFDLLVEKGDIVQCARCGEWNAFANQDHNMDVNTKERLIPDDGFADYGQAYSDEELLTNFPNVYPITCCSGFEWECGNCGANNIPIDSPLLAEVYTHVPLEAYYEEE
jgi:hypothetical protein